MPTTLIIVLIRLLEISPPLLFITVIILHKSGYGYMLGVWAFI